MSSVIKYIYDDKSFFIGGDIEKLAEDDLLNNKNIKLASKVMKLSHHGSSTSNQLKFLNAVNPDYFIISLGEDNNYGHPHKGVLNRLDSIGKKIYRTDKNGTITFILDNDQIEIITDK